MKKRNKVKRFTKIYKKEARAKSPLVLVLTYLFIFLFVATVSYLGSMAVNSYLKRPHCTEIQPLPEVAENNGNDDVKSESGSKSSNKFANESSEKEKAAGNERSKENENLSLSSKINGVEVDLKTLASKPAFERFLKKVKADEKNAIIVCLKGNDGRLKYDSKLKLAQKWQTVIDKNRIDFEEVAEKIKEEGLIPIARMSAFFDQTAPKVEEDNTFLYENSGGNRARVNVFSGGFLRGKWLDATKAEVRGYITGLAVEMARMGFENILIDNAWFPVFKSTYEIENFEEGTCNAEVRFQALLKFVNDLNSSGVKAIFSYPAAVFSDQKLAQSLFGKLNLLNKIKIHAPIFSDEAALKKSEDVLINLAAQALIVPEFYSNVRNINSMLKKLESLEIESGLIVRSN